VHREDEETRQISSFTRTAIDETEIAHENLITVGSAFLLQCVPA